jgi:hypothetical protein
MATGRGRPRTPAIPGRTYGLGITVEGDLKALLEHAADASGLTQSQEAARRLRASFDRDQRAGGQREGALLEAMGAAALAKVGAGWINDAERFSIVEQLWVDMLAAAAPEAGQRIVVAAEDMAALRAQWAQNPRLLQALETIAQRLGWLEAFRREFAKPSSDATADHAEEPDTATDRHEE